MNPASRAEDYYPHPDADSSGMLVNRVSQPHTWCGTLMSMAHLLSDKANAAHEAHDVGAHDGNVVRLQQRPQLAVHPGLEPVLLALLRHDGGHRHGRAPFCMQQACLVRRSVRPQEAILGCVSDAQIIVLGSLQCCMHCLLPDGKLRNCMRCRTCSFQRLGMPQCRQHRLPEKGLIDAGGAFSDSKRTHGLGVQALYIDVSAPCFCCILGGPCHISTLPSSCLGL